MIPKIIHYCWFGKGKKSPLIYKCIESWKKYCPDYKIIEWNEDNFDLSINRFVKEAYESKKYAFVSDYVRLYVLNKFGGIYVDTDLEIRRNIDYFLKSRAFSSFESEEHIPTAIMGAEKGHPWIKELLGYYESRRFILNDGMLDMKPNTHIITQITKERYGLNCNNKEQVLEEGIYIYPDYVLCNNVLYKKNYSVHHFNGSWIDDNGFYKNEFLKYKKNYNMLVELMKKVDEKTSILFPMQNYEKVYIFGSGCISKHLINYMGDMNFSLEGIISREEKDTIYGLNNLSIDELGTLNSNDLIIIVPSYDFESICNELTDKTEAELVSLEYILDIRISF